MFPCGRAGRRLVRPLLRGVPRNAPESERQAGSAATGWGSRERLAAPVAEIRDVQIHRSRTTVVYADRFTPGDERRRAERDGDEPGAIAFLKRFTVFNTDQCENLPDGLVTAPPPVTEGLILPQAEALIDATGADFRIGGDRAFFSPANDYIQVPRPDAHFEPINWHRTDLHELGHWVGHPSRLARDLSGAFGSALYAKEELVAEMTSAFVCASLGIVPTVRHTDYLGSWLKGAEGG